MEANEIIQKLKSTLQDRDNCIKNLQIANKRATESAIQLNTIMNENRKRFETEKSHILEKHRLEIKSWKKDLGRARSSHIKLEKKFALLEVDKTGIHLQIKPRVSEEESTVNVNAFHGSDTLCSICAAVIPHYIPDYFCGEAFNPACSKCKGNDSEDDPFSSFPLSGTPISLAAHWFPSHAHRTGNLGCISSLRAHYTMLPNPGDEFVSMAEVLAEFRLMMEKERKRMKNDCKQS